MVIKYIVPYRSISLHMHAHTLRYEDTDITEADDMLLVEPLVA